MLHLARVVREMRALLALFFLVTLVSADSEDEILNGTAIKCRVCAAAVSHIWQTGEALRRDCEARPREDRLCEDRFVSPDAVVHLVESTCEHLPKTHSSTTRSHKIGDPPTFDIVRRRHHPRWRSILDADSEIEVSGSEENPSISHPGDDAFHSKENADTLRQVCTKWIHERHTIDKVAAIVFSNLQAGRTEGDIMRYLRRRFCFPACGNGSRRLIKKPRWDDEL